MFGLAPVYYQSRNDGTYWVYTVADNVLAQSLVSAAGDVSDFQTNYLASATQVDTLDDAWLLGVQQNTRSFVRPRAPDGREVHLPNLFPNGSLLYYTGAGDDINGNSRGTGQAFNLTNGLLGQTSTTWQFLDWVYIVGGGFSWTGALLGDWVSLMLTAPSTPVTPNGGGTGNCNLVSTNGLSLIVPASGNGAYNVNLANAIPIPADENSTNTPTGYWEWSTPDTGKGTVSAGVAGKSHYNLFNNSMNLTRFVNQFQMVGSGVHAMVLPAVKPKRILPHWSFTATINNCGLHTLSVAWYLSLARTQTT